MLAYKGLQYKDIPLKMNGEYFQIVELEKQKLKGICVLCRKQTIVCSTFYTLPAIYFDK